MLPLLISLSLASWGATSPVDTPPPTAVRAINTSAWSATATGWEDSFLFAWQDYRFAGQPVVMVSRVSGDGGVKDPIGLVASRLRAGRPALSASGSLAVVAWEEGEQAQLRLLRDDGTWASAQKYVGGRCPAVAMGASGGIVVSEQGALKALRFDTAATALDATPLDLSSAGVPWGTCAAIALDDSGANALVMWRDANTQTVFGVNVPLQPPVGATSPVTFATGAGVGGVGLVATGVDTWFGVSAFTPMPPLVHLQGYDVSTTGGPVQVPFLDDAKWLQLELARCAPGVCFLGTNETANIVLSLGHLPLDGGASVVVSQQNTNASDFALAATRDGQRLGVAVADYTDLDVSVANSDFSGQTPFVSLTSSWPAQVEPDVAVSGDVALVAWIEQEASTGETVVHGKRYDQTGAALDATALSLVVPAGGEELSEVELMPTDTGWLVAASAWGSERSWLVPVSQSGQVGAQSRLALRGMHLGFVRTGSGQVLASAKQYQTMWWDPVLVTISPDGGEVTTRMQDTGPKEHYTDVAITGTGEALVVWQDVDPDGMLDGIVAGKRIGADGAVLDADALRFTSPLSREALEPQVVGDGKEGYFLVSRSYRQLWAQHIASGVATAPKQLLAAPADYPGSLHLAASGDGKAVVSFADPSDGGVLARELSVDSSGVTVTELEPLADVPFDSMPAFAVGPGAVWATWARVDTTNGNTMRVFVRTWQRGATGSTCTAGWMCASNQCGGGACQPRATPSDAGALGEDAGVIMLPDGGMVLADGGVVGAPRGWNLKLGPSCSAVDGVSVLALGSLLLLRRRRR